MARLEAPRAIHIESRSPQVRQFAARDRALSERRRGLAGSWHTHPSGESKRHEREVALAGEATASGAQLVDTLGGRMHVRWDEGAAATPHGQLVLFAEFLSAAGVFDR